MGKLFKLFKLDKYPEVLSYLTVLGMTDHFVYGFIYIITDKVSGLVYPLLFLVIFSLISNIIHTLAIGPLYKRTTVMQCFNITVMLAAVDVIACLLILYPGTYRLVGITIFVIGELIYRPVLTVLGNKFIKISAYYNEHLDGFDISEYQNHRQILISIMNVAVGVIALTILLPNIYNINLTKEVQELTVYDEKLIVLSTLLVLVYVIFRGYVVRKTKKDITSIIDN